MGIKNIIKMESNDEKNKISIKYCKCCYFYDIIKFEDFDLDSILVHEQSYKNILVYEISYKNVMGAKLKLKNMIAFATELDIIQEYLLILDVL